MTETPEGAARADSGPPPEEALGSLTQRESDLLRKAGERVFALSRKLAESERQVARHRQEAEHLRELLAETRMSRDTLSAQVSSLQRELEREYEERAELRRLLSSLQLQMQAMLPMIVAGGTTERPALTIGRTAGQRGAVMPQMGREAPLPPEPAPVPQRRLPNRHGNTGWLRKAARDLRGLAR